MTKPIVGRIAMSSIFRDITYSLRSLRKTPASSATAVAVIAIGLGANLAVFAVTFGILLRPLPFAEPERLAALTVWSNDAEFGVRLMDAPDWRQRLTSVESLSGYAELDVVARGTGAPLAIRAAAVEPSFFSVLGAVPAAGSTDAFEAVLSHGLARRLGGDTDVSALLGSRLRISALGETAVSVVVSAVMPSDFAFPSDQVDLWLVNAVAPPDVGPLPGQLVIRTASGAGLAAVQADAQRVLRELQLGDSDDDIAVIARSTVTPIAEALSGDLRPVLSATTAAALLVLLATSANVAILLLGRALLRRRADAVRLALGARPWRLARAAWVDSAVVTGLGTVGGWWLAYLALGMLDRVARGVLPRWHAVKLDAPILASGVGLALLTAVLCGAATAMQASRNDATAALRAADSTRSGHQRLLSVLVVAQVALAFVLLAGGALLGRSALRLWQEDAGFDPSHTVVVRLALDGTQWPARHLLDRVRALPGVTHAGLGSSLPASSRPMKIQVRRLADGVDRSLLLDVVSATPGFLEAVGARRVAGRGFESTDERVEAPDLILSRSGLGLLEISTGTLPSDLQAVAGHEYKLQLPPLAAFDGSMRILGIVDDVKYTRLDSPPSAALYLPWAARPARQVAFLAVRTDGGPKMSSGALSSALHSILREIAPALPIQEISTLEDLMARSVADRTLVLLPALGFAVVALAVALSGVFAVVARSVAERRRDFAIRKAIGATRFDIAAQVLRQAGRLVTTGLAFGLLLAIWSGRGLQGLLYAVEPLDMTSLAGAALLLLLTCVVACLWQARRAAGTDPAEILRGQ